ncbi:MAG: amidohydrolase [Clostridiales bacterium]|nr:amidohydrolase [Clostridiales bacterium]
MLFENITILDKDLQVQGPVFVGIKADRIDYIGKEKPEADYGDRYDGKGKLLMPGFVNAHAHSPMMLMRGYGENMVLQDWLNKRIFPFEDCLTGDAVYNATLLAMAESLRAGIVSSTDMYYFCDDMARAILDSGAKSNLSRSIVAFQDAPLRSQQNFQEALDLFERYHGAGDGRLLIDMSLHAEYTSLPRTALELAQETKALGARMHVHVSETQFEHEGCKERHGKTPAAYLNDLGLFDSPTTAAHCVWAEPEDLAIFAEKGVTVASCPMSNAKLASGVCNIREMNRLGLNVALGTDSVASNNSLNFLEEIKLFSVIHKVYNADPTLITPEQAILTATRNGFLSQGRKDSGVLEEGKKADLVVLDISGPHHFPVHNVKNNLVYSADNSDVRLTMVDGRVLYKDGEFTTIDVEKVKAQAQKDCDSILARLA